MISIDLDVLHYIRDDVKDRTKNKIGRGRRQERIRGVHPEEAVMHHSGGEGRDVKRGRDETSILQAANPAGDAPAPCARTLAKRAELCA